MGDIAWQFFAVMLTIVVPAIITAFAQGWTSRYAMDAIWRQPEAAGDIRTTLIIALAFMEALTIYGLLIAFMLQGKLG
jgi:F-type H+-transporting ATPase subunit c